MLDIFYQWAQQTMAALPAGVLAEFTINEDSENRSARLDLDAPPHIARVTCWSSGNFHLEVLESSSGREVLEQHGKVELPSALSRALQPVFAFLSKQS